MMLHRGEWRNPDRFIADVGRLERVLDRVIDRSALDRDACEVDRVVWAFLGRAALGEGAGDPGDQEILKAAAHMFSPMKDKLTRVLAPSVGRWVADCVRHILDRPHGRPTRLASVEGLVRVMGQVVMARLQQPGALMLEPPVDVPPPSIVRVEPELAATWVIGARNRDGRLIGAFDVLEYAADRQRIVLRAVDVGSGLPSLAVEPFHNSPPLHLQRRGRDTILSGMMADSPHRWTVPLLSLQPPGAVLAWAADVRRVMPPDEAVECLGVLGANDDAQSSRRSLADAMPS